MFISYDTIKYLGYNDNTKKHSYQYRIIDSDFEEVAVVVATVDAVEATTAVITTYEKRNLPVAPNLLKAMLAYSKKYGYTVGDIIAWNIQYNPKFSKYEKDIEKYLILI